LQDLLNNIDIVAVEIDMSFNTKKTVCVLFNPIEIYKIVCIHFPRFCFFGHRLSFVPVFKYLGHIIDNEMQDDGVVLRELKCLLMRTNILICRFARCSVDVKVRLFR